MIQNLSSQPNPPSTSHATNVDIESQVLAINNTNTEAQPRISNFFTPMQSANAQATIGGLSALGTTISTGIGVAIVSAVFGALTGYASGAVGGLLLDQANAPAPFNNLGQQAGLQGVVGNALLAGAVGFFAGGNIANMDRIPGSDRQPSNIQIAQLLIGGTLLLSLGGNAIGNILFELRNLEHTTLLQGAVASVTGVTAFSTASTGILLVALIGSCLGRTAMATVNS